jgi:putative flippase GtrA
LVGFTLNKFLVFADSYLRGRIQLFRYFLSFLFNLTINYFVLKLLVQVFYIEAVLSQVITTVIIIAIGYITQKHFTFKISNDEIKDVQNQNII